MVPAGLGYPGQGGPGLRPGITRHTLTLSNFEQTSRQTGKPFKEWSGNISIKILGRGEATSTYAEQTLVEYVDRDANGTADTHIS